MYTYRKYIILVIVSIVAFFSADYELELINKKPKYEKDYQKIFCKKHDGVMEHQLNDKTRVDCLTDEYAVEIDFAKKWAEGIGQSLYYSLQTGKKPAVGLIVDTKSEARYLKRLKSVAKKYDIQVFVIEK